jgi:FimV-like protein
MDTIEIGELSILVMGVHLSLRKHARAEKERVAHEIGRIVTGRLAERFEGAFRYEIVAIEDGCIKVRLKLFWDTAVKSAEKAIFITAALVTIATSAPDLIGPKDATPLQCGGITVTARYDGSDFTPGCHYIAESGDSLGGIAERYPQGVYTRNQVMVAMFLKNPAAFIDGNMNRLKAGGLIVFPTLKEIGAVSPARADRVVAQHERDWRG